MLTVTPLAKPFAAEIRNIDLSRPIGDGALGEILAAWARHPVLAFRDQELDTESQQAFAARFGKLAGRSRPADARGKNVKDNPYLMLVTNVRDEAGQPLGSGESPQAYHTDGCFRAVPTMATFLYGMEVPADGGETLFVDMNEVYDDLSAQTKARIAGHKGVNYHYFGYRTFNASGGAAGKTMDEAVTHAAHPLVIAHPVTGKPVVFANRHNTRAIAGLEPAEAKPILREIFEAIDRPGRVYAHKWEKGDLVMWDNRAVQHARAPCPPDQRRMLRRFAVECEAPPRAYRG
jgi:taurine dioxygenase